VLVLIDQSGSVAPRARAQAQVRAIGLAVIERLRQSAQPGDTLEVAFFGASVQPAVPRASLRDAPLDLALTEALSRSQSLGGTLFDQAFAAALALPDPEVDVLIISDGLPDSATVRDPAGRERYAAALRAQVEQLAARRRHVSFALIGTVERSAWLALWQAAAERTGGVLAELRDSNAAASAEASAMAAAFADAIDASRPTPTPTPLPTATPRPTPTPTPQPTATPRPTPRPTSLPAAAPVAALTATPAATATARPDAAPRPESPLLPLLAGTGLCLASGLLMLAVIGGGLTLARRRARHHAAHVLPADEGCLEIYDATSDAVRRVELRAHAVGEVLTIGGGVPEGRVMAALALTPRGPRLEGRDAPLQFDGRSVQQHMLFDNDVVYLDRFILYYHNFFRQRSLEAEA
jgi:hypothetical protein